MPFARLLPPQLAAFQGDPNRTTGSAEHISNFVRVSRKHCCNDAKNQHEDAQSSH
jgi:hypothetical protein